MTINQVSNGFYSNNGGGVLPIEFQIKGCLARILCYCNLYDCKYTTTLFKLLNLHIFEAYREKNKYSTYDRQYQSTFKGKGYKKLHKAKKEEKPLYIYPPHGGDKYIGFFSSFFVLGGFAITPQMRVNGNNKAIPIN